MGRLSGWAHATPLLESSDALKLLLARHSGKDVAPPATHALVDRISALANGGGALVAAPAAAPAAGLSVTGKLLERVAATPYSYLRIQTAQGEVWAAVPETKVEKGAEVTVTEPCCFTPRDSMQRCRALITTPTPFGFRLSQSASAT